MNYEFFEHTADTKFRAYGKNLEEAFSNAALALTSILVEPKDVKPATTKSITVRGHDLKALLYEFLEQFLIFVDRDFFLLNKVESMQINRIENEYLLNALISGDIINKEHELDSHVKAITYNEMLIEQKKEGCMVQVVPDL